MGIGSTCVPRPTMLVMTLITSPRFVGNHTLVLGANTMPWAYTALANPSPLISNANTPEATMCRNTPSHMDSCTPRRLCAPRLCPWLLRIVCPSSSSLCPSDPRSDNLNLLMTSIADVPPLMWGYKLQCEITCCKPHFHGEPPCSTLCSLWMGLRPSLSTLMGPFRSICYALCILRRMNVFLRSSGVLRVRPYLFVRYTCVVVSVVVH